MINIFDVRLHKLAALLSIVLMLVGTLISILMLKPKMIAMFEDLRKQRAMLSVSYTKLGEQCEQVGRSEVAYEYYRLAEKSAMTDEARYDAMLKRIEFHVREAAINLNPHAILVNQFCEGLLAVDKRPETYYRVYKALMQSAGLQGDFTLFTNSYAQASWLATSEKEKFDLLKARAEGSFKMGNWTDFRLQMDKIDKSNASQDVRLEAEMLKASALEKVLKDPQWFKDWKGNSVETDEALRVKILERLLVMYGKMIKAGGGIMVDEALFRSARLCFDIGDYDNARVYVDLFFKREPGKHQAEILLMMTQMAHRDGNLKHAERLLEVFISRFSWNDVSYQEFKSIVEEISRNGKENEALLLVDKYISMPEATSKEIKDELLAKGGELAYKLGQPARAQQYYTELLKRKPDPQYAVQAMLGIADIMIATNNLSDAKNVVTDYLTSFPYEKRRSEALYKLYVIEAKDTTSPANLISVAVAASNENPADPFAVKVVLGIAKELERIGAYSMAQVQYNRILLLHYIQQDSKRAKQLSYTLDPAIAEAMLGDARCLLQLGAGDKADQRLRDICGSDGRSETKSEAALLWAGMAISDGQNLEAKRRLSLVDKDASSKAVISLAQIESLLLDVREGRQPGSYAAEIVKLVDNLPEKDQKAEAVRIYKICFDRMEKSGDLPGLVGLMSQVIGGKYGSVMPVTEFNFRVARVVLNSGGVEEMAQYLAKSSSEIKAAGIADVKVILEMQNIAEGIIASKKKLEKYM